MATLSAFETGQASCGICGGKIEYQFRRPDPVGEPDVFLTRVVVFKDAEVTCENGHRLVLSAKMDGGVLSITGQSVRH